MDDEAYVQELPAILTNPRPSGIDPADPYGLADDGIDRYDGFGRDFWVERLQQVSDGPWDKLEPTFGVMHDPRVQGRPRGGICRVTFDLEWRELSRYADPAAYAPMIAWQVGRAARKLVQQHGSSRPESQDGDAVRRSLPAAQLWERLIAHLGSHGPTLQTAPGRLEVNAEDGTDDVLTVLVTPEQWVDLVIHNPDWPCSRATSHGRSASRCPNSTANKAQLNCE